MAVGHSKNQRDSEKTESWAMSRTNRKPIEQKKETRSAAITISPVPSGEGIFEQVERLEASQEVFDTSDTEMQTAQTLSESRLPSQQEIEIDNMSPDSLAARWSLERRSILRELHRALVRHIIFYTKPEGGGLTMEEAIKQATELMEGPEEEDYCKMVTSMSVSSISWLSLDRLFRYDPKAAQELWEEIKEQAELDFKSGHFAAQIFESAEWQQDPWKRAHFIAVRDSFIEQFKPQGGIDFSMIDMLAVTFTLWMHWTQVHMQRSTTEAAAQLSKTEKEYIEKYEGRWVSPRVSEQEATEHAAQMADRWRRAYQATVRQMRDWRRYNAPVTINNPRQVNIAADGGKQINAVKVKD